MSRSDHHWLENCRNWWILGVVDHCGYCWQFTFFVKADYLYWLKVFFGAQGYFSGCAISGFPPISFLTSAILSSDTFTFYQLHFYRLAFLPTVFLPFGIFTTGIFTIGIFTYWHYYRLTFSPLALLLSGMFTTGISITATCYPSPSILSATDPLDKCPTTHPPQKRKWSTSPRAALCSHSDPPKRCIIPRPSASTTVSLMQSR